jgi:hypothetical protein
MEVIIINALVIFVFGILPAALIILEIHTIRKNRKEDKELRQRLESLEK